MIPEEQLPATFVSHAANVLSVYFTGSTIVEKTLAWAVDCNLTVPYHTYPNTAPNKRTMLRQNLEAFSAKDQFRILEEFCNEPSVRLDSKGKELRIKLMTEYGPQYAQGESLQLAKPLIESTKHWLDSYPSSFSLYIQAEQKYHARIYTRNLLDDLRLSLEGLLKEILNNNKSLENQTSDIGQFLSKNGCSPEFRNMFHKLVEYYSKYQNSYVKHNDLVIEEEVEFVFEITSSFIKHLVKANERA